MGRRDRTNRRRPRRSGDAHPPGADAHAYEPSQQQIAALQTADLVIANGLGLEAGLEDLLEGAIADGAQVLELAPRLDPIALDDEHEHEHDDGDEHEHEHGHEGDSSRLDPHVWFDLSRVDAAAGLIAERLSRIDDSVDWESRALAYSEKLLATDQEISRLLDAVALDKRKLVTNHEALGYFAARYQFEIVGVVIPGGSTLGDPSSAQIAALVEKMTGEGIATIFAETSQPARLAETIAAEVGEEVSVVELHTESLGDPGSGAATLTDMVLTDARLIAEALAREPVG